MFAADSLLCAPAIVSSAPRRRHCPARRSHARRGVARSGTQPPPAPNEADVSPTKPQVPPASDESFSLQQLLVEAISSPLVYVTLGIAVGVKVIGANDSVASVVGLSALPVVGLSVLAKTPFGRGLEDGLKASKAERRAASERALSAQAAARAAMPRLFGPNRVRLVASPPAHLDGTLPADEGFDPLSLGAGGRLAAMRTAELLHARWAMLAAPGVVVPELLSRSGVELGEPVWWKVGASKLAGDTLNWGGLEGFHIAGGQGVAVIAACQLVLMGGPEYARYVGVDSLEPVGVPLPGEPDYPGGAPFDPLKLSSDATFFEKAKVDEIRAGRLAMVAFLGFAAQAAATHAGPVANLLDGRA